MKIKRVFRKDEAELNTELQRIDYMPFPEDGPDGDYMSDKMLLTEEGFLKGRAIVTNVGVFPYLTEDGVRYELRPPEEVFHPDSIETLRKSVMTNDHPTTWVNSENAKELGVGFTGDKVNQDQYHLSCGLKITDKKAVEDIMGGKKALSCGYFADLEMSSGNWMGIHYDAIQRNIRYNHVAIVPKGRAGDAAKMKMDAAEKVGIQMKQDSTFSVGERKIEKQGASSMKLIVDGVEYDTEKPEFSQVIAKLSQDSKELEQVKVDSKAELEKINKDLSTATAKTDQLEEETEKLKKDLEDLKAEGTQEKVDAAVQARLSLLTVATKAGVEVKADSTDKDIMSNVVLKLYPDSKEKLDGADEVYLKARFDLAIEALDADPSGGNTLQGDSLGDSKKKKEEEKKDQADEVDSDDARKNMIDRMKADSRKKED